MRLGPPHRRPVVDEMLDMEPANAKRIHRAERQRFAREIWDIQRTLRVNKRAERRAQAKEKTL